MTPKKRQKIRMRVTELLAQEAVAAPPVPINRIAKALGSSYAFRR